MFITLFIRGRTFKEWVFTELCNLDWSKIIKIPSILLETEIDHILDWLKVFLKALDFLEELSVCAQLLSVGGSAQKMVHWQPVGLMSSSMLASRRALHEITVQKMSCLMLSLVVVQTWPS